MMPHRELMYKLAERDEEYAREAMNRIWDTCKKLQSRTLSLYEAINDCTIEVEQYWIKILLDKEVSNGKEITNTG